MNPLLQRMGYSASDRVVIVHADDIGMCHASTALLDGLFATGVVTSASVMIPCAWAATAAAWCAAHPRADVGVHFTLTSEWATYRWRPLTDAHHNGLADATGFMPRSSAEVFDHAQRDAVAAEIDAQYALALAWGMQPSHCDSHMGTMFGTGIFECYMALGQRYQVPVFVPRQSDADLARRGFDAQTRAAQMAMLHQIESSGMPFFDHMRWLELGDASVGLAATKQLFHELPAGLTYFIHHPSIATSELRGIAPDWQARVRDFVVMTDPELRTFVEAAGIHLIGWRDIQQALAK
ncbi:MAG: ChbG/HpnK family deacetylase [Chloroflexia bacterium]|nr:ChbG/HpnK family deacetylase [Chloroflexia bacterium]